MEKEIIFTEFAHNYYCVITDRLDELAGIENREVSNKLWNHYCMIDRYLFDDYMIAIRIPGGTVGTIKFDKEFYITDIVIDTNYVVKTYDPDVNAKIKEYIGWKLIFPEEFMK